ncbi:MAG: diaminopimelate decarboxylase [Verrucomicrobia bacterium]|nr:diaminopimelate decarboxylase [Verrucomicrobiota bacterium]
MQLDPALLLSLANKVGTPFWLYDAATMRQRISEIQHLTSHGLQARFAMKSCPATKVLSEMQKAGIWIDAVSGNEALRAIHAGHAPGQTPPVILYTSDVFRDNALEVVLQQNILPNIGSPGMIAQLAAAGYKGDVSIRVNPGFGHGHVNSCDTGGPSSKHGVWFGDLEETARKITAAGMRTVMLHAHIGSGPRFQELHENIGRLADEFAALLPLFPDLQGVSLGGGIPHNYRDAADQIPLEPLRELFAQCREKLSAAAGRPLRVEIEPGRYFVASSCVLVTRVAEVKSTQTNEKGRGATFAMVDAGFVDLVRPAMYGSYHGIEVVPQDGGVRENGWIVVAGPLCESGDVFTRDDAELLNPRQLPTPVPGDLLVLRDAGAYGYAMSSNYNSIGKAPQVWLEPDGRVELISRRETLADLLKAEVSEVL